MTAIAVIIDAIFILKFSTPIFILFGIVVSFLYKAESMVLELLGYFLVFQIFLQFSVPIVWQIMLWATGGSRAVWDSIQIGGLALTLTLCLLILFWGVNKDPKFQSKFKVDT